ncbi:hypothetical protein [Pseudomonas sp. RIT-PI-AD]|uniref:hypothetical protein n=1 Tax=Pseudomonas sp. RIT-PI-AD TaxID=3035294 RepID=UPI0021D8B97B|nr:hypothetical protein [Pseudomonas sp. RIT-PI-AD]
MSQGTLKIDVTANLTRLDADLNKASSLIKNSIDAFGKRMRNSATPLQLPVEIAPQINETITQEMRARWRASDQKYWKPEDEYKDRIRTLQEEANAGELTVQQHREGIERAQVRLNTNAPEPLSDWEKLGQDASKKLQETFTTFLFDPFNAKVDDLLLNFLKALQQMAAEAAAKKIVDSVSDSDLWKQGAQWVSSNWQQGVSWVSSMMASYFAEGGVFDQGKHIAFARGGAFSNSIVSQPTLFPFAKGTGLMGEAGPEAIMPLTRASNGSLGVRAMLDGGAFTGGNVIQINTHITIEEGKAKSEQQTGDSDAAGKQLSALIADGARTVVFKEQQPGGSIWRLVNGR